METLGCRAAADVLGSNLLAGVSTPPRHQSARSHLRATPRTGTACCSPTICRLKLSSADTPGGRRGFFCVFSFSLCCRTSGLKADTWPESQPRGQRQRAEARTQASIPPSLQDVNINGSRDLPHGRGSGGEGRRGRDSSPR